MCSLCSSDHFLNDILRVRLQKLSNHIRASENPNSTARAALEKCQILALETCSDLRHELPMAYLDLYEILHDIKISGFKLRPLDGMVPNHEFYKQKSLEIIEQTKLAHSKAAFTRRMRDLALRHFQV